MIFLVKFYKISIRNMFSKKIFKEKMSFGFIL